MPVVRRDRVTRWVELYEQAWRTPGTDRLAELFTADVLYTPSPWAAPLKGLDELALFWDAERDGADEPFTMTSEVLAVDADTAVIRVAVAYDRSPERPWRDLWVLRFAAGGRCAAFEEWPFSPDADDGHPPR
jgi:ketosteroid isomerase-like protein